MDIESIVTEEVRERIRADIRKKLQDTETQEITNEQKLAEVVATMREMLSTHFIGEGTPPGFLHNAKNKVFELLKSKVRAFELPYIDFDIKCDIKPNNFFTALAIAGIEAPVPPEHLGNSLTTEIGTYTFDGTNLMFSPKEDPLTARPKIIL